MQLLIIHSGNQQHSVMHAFIMFIISLTKNIVAEVKCTRSLILWIALIRNQLRRCNVPPNHRPSCSLISQQCCHPWAGRISPMNKELAGLHIAKDNKKPNQHSGVSQANNRSSKPTPLGLLGKQRTIQANIVGFIRPSRSWERINANIVSSLKS